VTHHFTLDQLEAAYDVFARAADMGDPMGLISPPASRQTR